MKEERDLLPVLEKRFEQMESVRQDLLNRLGGFSEAQLNFKPGPKQWSMLEVVEHLVAAEEMTAESLLGTLPELFQAGKPTLASRLKFGLLILIMRSPLRVPAPTRVVIPDPERTRTLSELTQRWEAARNQFRILLDEFTEEKLPYGVFRHPVSGPLNIVQTLGFLHEHLKHHLRQFRRIEQAEGFPQGNPKEPNPKFQE